MNASKTPTGRVMTLLERFASRHLVFVVGALFLVDLAVVDPVPFLDEVVLGVLTILLARWRSRRGAEAADSSQAEGDGSADPAKPPPKNVTPNA